MLTCWLLPGMMGWCGCGGLVSNVVFVVLLWCFGVLVGLGGFGADFARLCRAMAMDGRCGWSRAADRSEL